MGNKKHPILISWIGGNDIKALAGEEQGPICATLKTISFQKVELLYSYPEELVQPYLDYAHQAPLTSPVNFSEIYQQANQHLNRLKAEGHSLAILLSPGTPAMQSIWVLLGKARFPCTYYEPSCEAGVQQVDTPLKRQRNTLPLLVASAVRSSLSWPC